MSALSAGGRSPPLDHAVFCAIVVAVASRHTVVFVEY